MAQHDNRPPLGKRCRALRTQMQLTQAEFGSMLGVTYQTISAIEAGAHDANKMTEWAVYGLTHAVHSGIVNPAKFVKRRLATNDKY